MAKHLHLSPRNEILIEKLLLFLVSKFCFFKLCLPWNYHPQIGIHEKCECLTPYNSSSLQSSWKVRKLVILLWTKVMLLAPHSFGNNFYCQRKGFINLNLRYHVESFSLLQNIVHLQKISIPTLKKAMANLEGVGGVGLELLVLVRGGVYGSNYSETILYSLSLQKSFSTPLIVAVIIWSEVQNDTLQARTFTSYTSTCW